MKRVLSVLLAAAMLMTLFAIAPLSASAEKSGDFEYEILDDGTAEITKYKGNANVVTMPYYLDGYTVTSIGEEAFYNCTSLGSITIPNSVTTIRNSAFCGCTSLASITIPDSVTSIDVHAFLRTQWYNNQPDR